ncbi:coiled-coil domain-containing protein 130 homolog [Parasteatoda tepidariorum]|uniref:coiled-coil domain-containing protein 130 homolog n=1 Tax=Parasteatoda tepidariorum TaxID=114398 RepID=UPI000A2C07BF|nr:coiled-coil domain-containing protein 130 homolog [Parasteatoda tepidariorum]
MAERKAVNKYYPPDWTPSKGSINKFRGTHALRERARKLHLGILIIRFEMPYNIWCNGCENHIGMGVRYNAEKTKVGMYYSTPIYKFRMKCHLCPNHFEIQTDPQNLDYVILEGARRQERRWDPTQNEQIVPEDKDVSKKLMTDSMFSLEHGVKDKEKQKSVAPTISELEEYKEKWKDDYLLNKALRQQFRERKKEQMNTDAKDNAIRQKSSLEIKLLPETDEDRKLASLLKFTPLQTLEERQKLRRTEMISSPIFPQSKEAYGLSNLIREAKVQSLLKPLKKTELGITVKSKISQNELSSTNVSQSSKNSMDNAPSLVALDYDSSDSNS